MNVLDTFQLDDKVAVVTGASSYVSGVTVPVDGGFVMPYPWRVSMSPHTF